MLRSVRSLQYVLLFACSLVLSTVLGCSGGSSPQQTTSPPSALIYSTATLSLEVGTPLTSFTPTVTGSVTSYAVTPALPAGLSLSTTTGVISGTPTAATASAAYTVTASNAGGSATITLTIVVARLPPPSGLSYPKTSTYVGNAITPLSPTVTGTVTGYVVYPGLPVGLSLNTTTGVISGTPTQRDPRDSFSVYASNSSGSTFAEVEIKVLDPTPSQIQYAQTNLRGLSGFAVTPDTVTYTGSPATFTVSPALPAGLSLDARTGTISGTPLAATTTPAFYTVTAANSFGSISSTIQIYIASEPNGPGTPTYPSTPSGSMSGNGPRTLNLTIGEPAPTSLPYVFATLPKFTISPALPAGLSFDPATGAIYGTPTVVSPATTYTVTVTDQAGPNTGLIRLAVNRALDSVIDTEGSGAVTTVSTSSRILSLDGNDHWNLFDATTGAKIAAGNRLPSTTTYSGWDDWPIDMKGNTIMIGIPNGVEIRSAVDGSLISIIRSSYFDVPLPPYQGTSTPSYTQAALSADGRYVVGSNGATAELYSTSGSWITIAPGAMAAFSQQTCLLETSDSTQTTLTSVKPYSGQSTTRTLNGAFQGFFDDGNYFFTRQGATVWINGSGGGQQVLSLGTYDALGGYGSYIWTYDATSATLSLFRLSGGAAIDTYTFTGFKRMSKAGPGLLSVTTSTTNTLINIANSFVGRVDYAIPGDVTAISASSEFQWVANYTGRLADGASLSKGTPTFYSNGQIVAIAASSNKVAVALSNGTVQYFDTATKNLLGTINVQASDLAISSDGTTLAVGIPDPTLATAGETRIYSLLTGAMTASSVYRPSTQLSSNGVNLGYTTLSTLSQTATGSVVPSAGGAAAWTVTSGTVSFTSTLHISPDLTLFGVTNGGTPATSLYQNGSVLTAVPGTFVGWIDNNNLLVSSTTSGSTTYSIYTAAGSLNSSTPLPSSIVNFIPVDNSRIYATSLNAIYSLSSGNSTWSWDLPTYNQKGLTTPSLNNGAISGSYVVFINGYRVLRDLY
jgi:hypothetical protein